MKKSLLAWRRIGLALALVLGTASAVAADVLHIPRAAHPPVLSDYVAGAPPDAGIEVNSFRQYLPGDGEPSVQQTKAYLSYDSKYLYAVFICTDDPALVRARVARRDDLTGDDGVQLLIDTFHDKQRAFHFIVNPYGVQMDGQNTEGLDPDYDFDTQWESDGQLTPTGYVAMMAIPFKSLRFHGGAKLDWGIAVGRIISRVPEFSYWPYITQTKEGFIPQFADAEIDEAIPSGRNIQLTPYVYIPRSRALNTDDPSNPYWQRDDKAKIGLDAKFVLDDAFAVDATIKPDFSEVESDDPQVLINQRYQVQFPEKRPIFLENSGFFATPQQLFYSRAVADPQYGVRVTGRKDDWTVGGLLIDDAAAGKLLPASDPDFGKLANIGVLRVQKDVSPSVTLGMFASGQQLRAKHNFVGDVDTRIKLDENWVATGQFAGSRSDDADVGVGDSGYLQSLAFTRTDRNLNYSGQYLNISPNFSAPLGYIPRIDIRQTTQTASYSWIDPDAKWVTSHGPALIAVGTLDHNNKLQDWSTDLSYVVGGISSTSFEAHQLNSYELFDGIGFNKHGFLFIASSEWLSWITPTLQIGRSQSVNYQPAAGVLPFLGNANNISLDLVMKPTSRLRVEEILLWNDLHSVGPVAGFDKGTAVYRESLSRTKFNYQFNRFFAAHLIIDNNLLSTNSRLNSLADSKQRNYDLLLSYVPSPGTEVYVGYSNLEQNLRLVGNPPTVSLTQNINMSTGHQVFIKCSYSM